MLTKIFKKKIKRSKVYKKIFLLIRVFNLPKKKILTFINLIIKSRKKIMIMMKTTMIVMNQVQNPIVTLILTKISLNQMKILLLKKK